MNSMIPAPAIATIKYTSFDEDSTHPAYPWANDYYPDTVVKDYCLETGETAYNVWLAMMSVNPEIVIQEVELASGEEIDYAFLTSGSEDDIFKMIGWFKNYRALIAARG